MAVDLEKFVKQLEDSGIIAAETLKDFIPPKANPKNAEDLARELVQKKKLTKFQASEAYQGKAKSLVLGNYTILDKIGAGGMGQVFKAEHRRLKRVVAIKMLPPAVTKDKAAVARFQREVEAAAKLRHPNVVATDDADEAKGVHFLVMEYVEGRDLSALVKRDGPFAVAKAVNYVLQTARGLEFAHRSGVIHRDIKPANLLLGTDGTVKILDMGLARIESGGDAAAQAELTGTGAIMGTVDYMAPEQGMSTKNADARADIYSLGCTLHYLLIGKSVYSGETVMARMYAHHQEPIPNLRQLRSEVPEQVDAVFRKMVAKKIEDRYQSMTEVVAALERCGVGRDVSFSSQQSLGLDSDDGLLTFLKDIPTGPTHKPKPQKPAEATEQGGSRNKKPLLIGAGVLGVLALLAGVIISLKAGDDNLVVEVNEPDALVTISNEQGKVEITRKTDKTPLSISVDPGRHRLRVEKDGFQFLTKDFMVEAEGKTTLRARMVPVKPAAIVGQPSQRWKTPAFQQWMKTVQALPAEQQIEAVSRKMMELNPGFDGMVTPTIERGVVTRISLNDREMSDISPVRAFAGLKQLRCGSPNRNSKLSDLWPLRGLRLETFFCGHNSVSDLSPLAGMPLTELLFAATKVSDLSPLRGMPLTTLNFQGSPVSDLSPVRGMRLTSLNCAGSNVSDLSPIAGMPLVTLFTVEPQKITKGIEILRQMRSLETIGIDGNNKWTAAEFWKKFDAGEFGKPAAPAKLTYLNPAFEQWMKATQALPAEKQIEAVSKKLMELNPGFDGQVAGYQQKGLPKIVNGIVRELSFYSDNVTDISPVRALVGLKALSCGDSGGYKGKLSDLSPLAGMKLERLLCGGTKVSDLSPLQGMPLTELWCNGTQAASLLPLQRMHLTSLNCGTTQVSDLSPLKGMPLTSLSFYATNVSDLSPLQGMPLSGLFCNGTPVFDLSPLQGMNLAELQLTPKNITKGLDVARHMTSIKKIGTEYSKVFPPAEFWKKYDSGEFGKPAVANQTSNTPAFQAWMKTVAALPAEKQVEAVSKKLVELNPGFDGNVTHRVEDNIVTGLTVVTDNVADISPVRALAGLKTLYCNGSTGSGAGYGKIKDLSPLNGMSLTYLNCRWSAVESFVPLKGMALTTLFGGATKVSDLSPLRGMPLAYLECSLTPVSDLSPLEDCKSLTTLNVTKTRVTAASVTALQKSLPNCKILCDDPARVVAGQPNQPWNTPAFVAWMKTVAALPAEKQVEAVSEKLMELNPGFDGMVIGVGGKGTTPKIENGAVTTFGFFTDNVTDISPVRALARLNSLGCGSTPEGKGRLSDLSPLQGMSLTSLYFPGTQVADLAPLRGMPLTGLLCTGSPISDLSPLEGMRLRSLHFQNAGQISDLTPLRGMPLTEMSCGDCPISNLSPLRGMPLTVLSCSQTKVSDLSPLQDCKSLKTLTVTKTKVTPATVAALQKALPNCKIEWDGAAKPLTNINDPAFQQWMRDVQALPAERQIEAVAKKLQELNPGFDGKIMGAEGKGTPKIENGVVTELGFVTDNVTDLSPVRALVGLKFLACSANASGNRTLSDLLPLQGMKLTTLHVTRTQVSDLAPLEGMPLTNLYCSRTPVSDLSPLNGMNLVQLNCGLTNVSDLSALQGMNLTEVRFPPQKITGGLDVIRQMKSLKAIGLYDGAVFPPDEFWKKYDAGEFGKPVAPGKLAYLDPAFQQWVKATQDLPAEQQIEAVSKKLMELNPGFDGKLRGRDDKGPPTIEQGVVKVLHFETTWITDVSPLRAFAGLADLNIGSVGARGRGKVSDLSPLNGMQLRALSIYTTHVTDLTPLSGMPLGYLECSDTWVADLTPLEGMPLGQLFLVKTQVADLSALRTCSKLGTLRVTSTKVTAEGVAALQNVLPNCKIEWDDPAKPKAPAGTGTK
jgi:serine/threonine protein kinase/Leucine-rich repeat (LRR) protein